MNTPGSPRNHFARAAALLLSVLAGACSDVGTSVEIRCTSDSECPVGNVCRMLVCTASQAGSDAGKTADAGHRDAGHSDDAGPTDGGAVSDAGEPDGGFEDAGESDAGSDDAGVADGGPDDAGPADAGPADLAPTGAATLNGPVDGIECLGSEQLAFHIHAHLQFYVDGVQRLLPANIGIGVRDGGGVCYSFLHTHDRSGVVHIESPVEHVYTLGNLFNVWGQPLSSTEVGPAHGTVTAYLNGDLYTGDLAGLPLDAHNVVQLDVGTPVVPPQPFTFTGGL